MATYFHGNAEMPASGDGLQTLILMNPAYVGYADNHHQLPPPPPQASNFIFLNASSAVNHSNPPPSQIHHLTGIPLQAATGASSPQYQDVSELHYNLHNPLINNGAAREVKQGLSLSLSPQQPAPSQPLPGAAEVRVPNNVLLSCKYLKVAQELLDEVVFIGKKNGSQSAKEDNGRPMITAELSTPAAGDGESGGGDGRDKRGGELSTAEKQEIQMKKAKLVNMLDEVEQRYKQYQHEMQMVISWLEQAAGEASAKTYTALALQTISKQFRSLKDAILAQIRVAAKSLGQQQMEGSSRLKYIRGLGMIHHNAWRPQRGLPERSVSILRAWLFDHFLHPYPKDTDKIMLAKQTGLTRSQVSNWFINARVRLWKPMVEEMYTEELKGHQEQGSQDQIAGNTKHMKIPKLKDAAETEIKNKSRLDNNTTSSTAAAEADVENQHIAMNFFASYPMVGMEQFQPPYSGNGVSLTLGLQHCENLPISSANQDFMSTQTMHLGPANDFAPPTSARFAAQLLPDFVT